jgi:purine-binding chemotaxis protein CheW
MIKLRDIKMKPKLMDLRKKFGLVQADNTVNTRIIIMEINMDEKQVVLGAIADSVNDVLELDPDQIEDPPEIGSRWKSEFIKGIGKRDETFIIILDVDRVFSTDEIVVAEGKTGEVLPGKKEKPGEEPEIL